MKANNVKKEIINEEVIQRSKIKKAELGMFYNKSSARADLKYSCTLFKATLDELTALSLGVVNQT